MAKHIFIVNPAAGKGSEAPVLSGIIRDACDACGVDYEIHLTKSRDDAQDFVRNRILEKPSDAEYRFYACGGDGTLSDVINGAVGADGRAVGGVAVGCVPIGTGNDFVRNFSQSEFFLDITKQLIADPMPIDCYRVRGMVGGNSYDRLGVNMVNIGFDCDVVCKVAELKRRPLLPKKLAYILGVAIILRKNRGQEITVVTPEGESTRQFQLVAVANGGFCGGGFHSAPKSRLDDGLLDISLIKKVSRTTFLRLVGRYKAGTHLETRLGKKVVSYSQSDRIALRFPDDVNVSVDGEILKFREVELTVVPRALSFLVPVGVEYLPDNKKRS